MNQQTVGFAALGKAIPAPTGLSQKEQQHQIALRWAKDGRKVNLSRFDLSGVNLRLVDLAGANLSMANLEGADLYRAIFHREGFSTDLHLINLQEANLSRVRLQRVNLSAAKD